MLSLKSDISRIKFGFRRLDKVNKNADRRKRHAKKIDERKKLKSTDKLEIGHKLSVLTETLKKKDAPGKFYKSATIISSKKIKERKLII